MIINSTRDLKLYIKVEYGIDPVAFDGKRLEYHGIWFENAKGSVIDSMNHTHDFWKVQRKGQTIDFFKQEELVKAVDEGGSLLYWFIPPERD